jgi:hypothetical protein
MPHYKCVACKTRLQLAGTPADSVGDSCPECGAALEPVGDLAEVVGFRSIGPSDPPSTGEAAAADGGRADPVDSFVGRRHAILAQARLDAMRWVDDGGTVRAEAIAMSLPDPNE